MHREIDTHTQSHNGFILEIIKGIKREMKYTNKQTNYSCNK